MNDAAAALIWPALRLGALSFLIGSIPFGLIVGRVFFKSDIRTSGSGNIGAANAMRTYGKAGGIAVLLLDACKGIAAVLLARALTASIPAADPWAFTTFAGFAAVLGHCYAPWLNFKGGKGVATWLGVVSALAWPVTLGFVAVWLLAVVPTRWASLGSLSATILSAAALWWISGDAYAGLWAAAAAAVIVWKHRENIGRLLAGRENKIGFGKASQA